MTENRAALTVKEVSESLSLTEITIRRMLKSGALRGFKTSESPYAPWRVSPEAIEDYIKSREAAY